ncbi:MAG TPA: ribosome maturation factor RimM [Pyrinomonadaceae bacterium]|nr:ribosome maturation factor RimM [Pyrinomonadaceae bacterium]
MREDLIAIAKLARPRGLRGEIVGDVLTDFPERFDDLKQVLSVAPNGETSELEIERFWFQKNRIVFKFTGYDSIEAVEELRNCEICVAEDQAVELETDEFFDWELESCAVETVEGVKLGIVKEVMRTGGTEVLVVAGETKEYLIPFAETICTEIDVENKLIKVDAPEGLLDF